MIKFITMLLVVLNTQVCFAVEPGDPVSSTYDGSQSEVFKPETELALTIINGASTVSDCYNFEGLFEDTTDLISSLREQFPEHNQQQESETTTEPETKSSPGVN